MLCVWWPGLQRVIKSMLVALGQQVWVQNLSKQCKAGGKIKEYCATDRCAYCEWCTCKGHIVCKWFAHVHRTDCVSAMCSMLPGLGGRGITNNQSSSTTMTQFSFCHFVLHLDLLRAVLNHNLVIRAVLSLCVPLAQLSSSRCAYGLTERTH